MLVEARILAPPLLLEGSMRRRYTLLLVALLAFAGACGISPQPEPPNFGAEVWIYPNMILVDDVIIIEGRPGAASPPGALITAFNLNNTEPATTAVVAANGSFALQLVGTTTDTYRVQIRDGELRGLPLDLIPNGEGTEATPVVRALAECLIVEPGLDLNFVDTPLLASSGSTISLLNDCATPFQLAPPPQLRSPDTTSFVVSVAPGMETLPAGGRSDILVRFEPEVPGDVEEILFITLTSTGSERIPISLHGRALPP